MCHVFDLNLLTFAFLREREITHTHHDLLPRDGGLKPLPGGQERGGKAERDPSVPEGRRGETG